jgi:condensin-2 complex subunit H2
MSEEETKYKSLIQPIKDLAQNWDIDIAESLTDYLDELAGLTITLDGGHINLNFAEAALVIQGSTAVYSKKVEYLHQLVLQSLEFISNKKSNVISTNKVKSSNINQYDDESFLFGNDPDGLLLDHTLDNGLDLYLKNESAADLQMKKRHSLVIFNTRRKMCVTC